MYLFWINLDTCTNRIEYTKKILDSQNINHERVNAVTPKSVNSLLINENNPQLKCGVMNCKNCLVESSCLVSHMVAIEKGYLKGCEWFLVMEDDNVYPFEIDYHI